MKFRVIDDFLPQPYFKAISEIITSFNFPWYFKENITFYGESNNNLCNYGLDHFVIHNGEKCSPYISDIFTGFFGSLLEVSQKQHIDRCRVDMTLFNEINYKHFPHVDLYYDNVTTIFYMTNSDGHTEIYNETCSTEDQYKKMDTSKLSVAHKVEPKENRLLIFDGKYLHTGHSPSKTKRRVLINTNLI